MTVRDDIIAIPDEKLRNARIAADYLIFMDFLDAPRLVWTGWGTLITGGNTWQGIGDLISVSEIPASTSATAESVTLTLQGATSDMQELARAARTRVSDRTIIIYQQFFDVTPDDAGVQPWSPLMPAFAVYTGKMDRMAFSAERDGDATYQRTIELTTYNLFTNRNAAPNGLWTDSDQQRRSPGDLGCSRMPIYQGYSPVWTV
ncbi:MAG: hypothetical protein KKB02_12370 [Alphaproteobacteria bacterium]|nr:hypothetical protein [Alphaproteobacteria bacterium]